MPRTKEFLAWVEMRRRCCDPKRRSYKFYGGRGISVCFEWRNSFKCFLADVGLAPDSSYSLDRIDNNGNYESGNVRWATWNQQQRNRRSNHLLIIDGVAKTIMDWADVSGIRAKIINDRINKLGWNPKKAVFTPKYATRFGNRNNRHCKS